MRYVAALIAGVVLTLSGFGIASAVTQNVTHPYSVTVSWKTGSLAANCKYKHTTHYSNGSELEKFRGCTRVP